MVAGVGGPVDRGGGVPAGASLVAALSLARTPIERLVIRRSTRPFDVADRDEARQRLGSAHADARFFDRLESFHDARGTLLDNSIILYGSGASTTHNSTNLPTLLAGGANMGITHGRYVKFDKGMRMSNLHLSILHALDIRVPAFSDSTGVIRDGLFA